MHPSQELATLGHMSDVTRLIEAAAQGDRQAAADLLPLVYDELRHLATAKMAQERPGQTLEPTALVHEAYLRLVGTTPPQSWDSRGHFFAAAAQAMRRILVNRARDKQRLKRGGGHHRVDLDHLEVTFPTNGEDLCALDEALERLAQLNPPCANLIHLRFFAGLTIDEAAAAMGVAPRTAQRYWAFARAWLYDALQTE